VREGTPDKVLKKVMSRKERLSDRLTLQLKGEKHFATEKISPQMLIWAYDNIGNSDLLRFRQEFGNRAVDYLEDDVRKMRIDGRVNYGRQLR
jgi:hypothetical protein